MRGHGVSLHLVIDDGESGGKFRYRADPDIVALENDSGRRLRLSQLNHHQKTALGRRSRNLKH
jgi:hypothetical protein